MINNLLYYYFLEDTFFNMQVYLLIVLLFFGVFIQDFYNDKHSTTYKYITTSIGLIFTLDFTIFFLINYELIFFSVFNNFILNEEENSLLTIIKIFREKKLIPPIGWVFIIVFCIIGIGGIILSVLHYMVFAYVNIMLMLFKKKSFSDLTNHKKWYNWDNFRKDFEKEFGKKNE